MEGFFGSFKPFLEKYFVESLFLALAFVFTITSVTLYVYINKSPQTPSQLIAVNEPTPMPISLMVEVSGAVKKPGVYVFKPGSRLQDAIKIGGGLTEQADTTFVKHNFNMARYINDQEKYYIPTQEETANEVITAKKQVVDYVSPQLVNLPSETVVSEEHISINTALMEDIDTLPGIGPATAQKIIQARPYSSVEELVTKKVMTKSVFEKIKGLISI